MKEVGRIYTAIDADELEAGDLVLVGCSYAAIKQASEPCELVGIADEKHVWRFETPDGAAALAKLVCSKKHAGIYKAFQNGRNVECSINGSIWTPIENPISWSEDVEYRVKPEPKQRRMTEEEKLAEEYAQNNIGFQKLTREAFLAGYKAGQENAETDLATVAYMQGAECKMGKCQCTVCRYVRKEITREEAIRLVEADIEDEEKELSGNPKDRWATEVNLDFDRMFLDDLRRNKL